MVEFLPDGVEGFRDIGVIDDPAKLRVAFSSNHDIHLEAMAMQPPAFVRLREMRQQVRGFKLEGFSQFKLHFCI